MRSAVNQASNAENTAVNTAANLGAQASGIGSNLTPFLTAEMEHPEGYSQQDQSAMLSAGLGAVGGGSSALTGEANQRAATTGNAGGFTSALDEAARQRAKQGASGAEGIAAKNAGVKQTQQQEGAAGLGKMYGEDQSGMLNAMNQEHDDINSEVNANNSGLLQNMDNTINSAANAATAYAKLKNG